MRRGKLMKKPIVVGLIAVSLILLISGCGSSAIPTGVSQEEYDKVVAERAALEDRIEQMEKATPEPIPTSTPEPEEISEHDVLDAASQRLSYMTTVQACTGMIGSSVESIISQLQKLNEDSTLLIDELWINTTKPISSMITTSAEQLIAYDINEVPESHQEFHHLLVLASKDYKTSMELLLLGIDTINYDILEKSIEYAVTAREEIDKATVLLGEIN